MKSIKILAVVLLSSLGVLSGCQRANATDINVAYVNNNTINKDAVKFAVGHEIKGIRYGLTTTMSDGVNKLETYGIYGQLPIKLYDSKFNVTPQITAEKYREYGKSVLGFGVGLEYELAPSVRAEAIALSNRSFSRSIDHELDGESYLFGVTKTF